MKKILWLLFFYPCFVFGQSNALYSLLNWNTPEQQKGLIAWYDLQDPSVVQLVSDQRVSMLQDKSIWKNHITQPTSTYQPLFISDSKLNTSGKVNGISFANGGYMMLKFPSTKTVQGITSFVICKNSLGGSKLLYDLGLEGGEGVASCYAGNDKIESRVPNSLAAFVPNFSTNPDQYLFIATKGSGGNVQASLNDSQSGGQGARNFVGSQYNRIRLSTVPGDAPTDGTLYELILFDRELTHEEYWKVKNYLEAKYNIQRLSAIPKYSPEVVNSNIPKNEQPTNMAQKKGFDVFLDKYNNINSQSSVFAGNRGSYPQNPEGSIYTKLYSNGKLTYEGYVKELTTSSNGNSVYKTQTKEGRGKEYFINSNGYFDGFFMNGKLNGYGEHISAGYSYKGYFSYGTKNGQGILVSDGLNGTTKYIYEGNFLNDKFNGNGTITYNFMSYTGNFVNGQISGSGVYLHPNGSKYVGNSVNGKYDGFGEYYFADGSYYIGNFSNDKFNGNGELSNVNGTKQKGVWQNGNYVGEEKIIVKSEMIEGRENKSTSSVNSAAKTSSVNCTYRFTIPTIKWKFIDNRKVCAYCKKIYVPYTRNQDIESDKKINIAALMRSRLNDHFASANASDEHIASDKARFTKFLVNNNFSLWGILGSEFQNAMGMMEELLIGDKNYGITEINLYSVENSDFCSYEHEDLYKRYRR